MDQQFPQPANQVALSQGLNNTILKTILILAGVLILGFTIGFILRPIIYPQIIIQKPILDESKLPISLALLTNPIVYEWRGSVKGKITQKDEHTFTLVDDKNNSITVTDIMPSGDKWKTLFFDKNDYNKQASYSAIPVGSTLLGDFFIFKNGPDTPVGGMFVIQ